MDFTITIDNDKCRMDGLCAEICPNRIFVVKNRGEVPVVSRPEACCLCGQCMAICPGEAIAHSRVSIANFEKITARHPLEPVDLDRFLRQRRSVRVYKDRDVDRDLLESVIGPAAYAPTGAFEGIGWVRNVTVVRGAHNVRRVRDMTAEYLKKLRKVLSGFMLKTVARFSPEARAGLTMIPDIDMRLGELAAGRDAICYDAPVAVFVHTPRNATTPQEDCDAALFSMILAAHAHDLGTCWNGWLAHAASGKHVRGFTLLREYLKIPENHKVYAAMTLGWPGRKLHSVPQREVGIHWIE